MTDSDTITIGAGGPPPEADIPDGTYPMILTDIRAPRTVTIAQGDRRGETTDLRDWVFHINATGHPLDGRECEGSTSLASGPKSKQFQWLTAFNGGRAPDTGQQFSKTDLVGRMVLGSIYHDNGNYPKVGTLTAMPVGMLQQQVAHSTGAPVNGVAAQEAGAAAPLRDVVSAPAATAAAPADDLPF